MNHLFYFLLAFSLGNGLILAKTLTNDSFREIEHIDKELYEDRDLDFANKKWDELDRMLLDPHIRMDRDEVLNLLKALSEALDDPEKNSSSSLTDRIKGEARKMIDFYDFRSEWCTAEHFREIEELYIIYGANENTKMRDYLKSIENQHFHKCSSTFLDDLQKIVSNLDENDKKNVERLLDIGKFAEPSLSTLYSDYYSKTIFESVLNFLETKHGRLNKEDLLSKFLPKEYIHDKVGEVLGLCKRINGEIYPVVAVFEHLTNQRSLPESELYWFKVYKICRSIDRLTSVEIRDGILRLLDQREKK